MAIAPKDQIKAWFKRGMYPTAAQFSDWIDSFIHKTEDQISINSVGGLADRINEKYPNASGEALEHLMGELQSAVEELTEIIATKESALFHTNAAWETADLDTLQSWIDTTSNTAHDPINDRDVNNFDVYLTLDANKNYYWDTGAWVVLAPSPEERIGVRRHWSPDSTTIKVILTAIPKESVTTDSFEVWDISSEDGATITPTGVTGAGTNYTLVIPEQSGFVGVGFIGE